MPPSEHRFTSDNKAVCPVGLSVSCLANEKNIMTKLQKFVINISFVYVDSKQHHEHFLT